MAIVKKALDVLDMTDAERIALFEKFVPSEKATDERARFFAYGYAKGLLDAYADGEEVNE
jgi:hypothetical protein